MLAVSVLTAAFSSHVPAAEDVKITETAPGRLRVEVNGELFTEYCFGTRDFPWMSKDKEGNAVTNWPKHVFFYPLLGPGGTPMTRNWPMKETAEEERDHPHHRSLWYSHGAVNGIDFWAETPKSGSIVHDKFIEMQGGKESGVIRSANKWIAPNGETVMTDERTFRVYARPNNERLFDFEVTLKAPPGKEIILGDTKEGSMSIRVNEQMRLSHGRGKPGKGHIVQSTGERDDKTWGKRAEWCDYSGPVDGKVVGISIFDHPSNPKHPTWWHVRDYGLFGANPFGVADFEKKPKGTGDITIPAGGSVMFKYRFYLHEGDEQQAKVAERYKQYATETK